MTKISEIVGATTVPTIRAADLEGRPFWIYDAREVETKFGKRIVFEIEVHKDNGRYALFLGPMPFRLAVLKAIAEGKGPIGPCTLERQGRAWALVDWSSEPVEE